MSEQALPTTARAWHLEARPQGQPVPSEFALRDLELPTLDAGDAFDILSFMFSEELDLQPDFVRDIGGWLAQGKLHYRETRDGLDNTLDAFLAMMQGENVGKMIVKL